MEVSGLEGSQALPPDGVDELDVETVLVPQRLPQTVHSFDRPQISRPDLGAALAVSTRQSRLQSTAQRYIRVWKKITVATGQMRLESQS